MIFRYIKNLALDLLFPKRCLGCRRFGDFLCYKCQKNISFLPHQSCPHCRKENNFGNFCDDSCHKNYYFDQLIVCARYDKSGIIKNLITNFKYKFNEDIAKILSIILMTQYVFFSQYIQNFENACLVPVPLHKKRFSFRGFNQSKILCEQLKFRLNEDKLLENRFSNIKIADLLERTVYRPEQAKLSRYERLINLKGTIDMKKENKKNDLDKEEASQNFIHDKFLVLFDDVATTCATLNECSKVLKENGAKYICCFVIARGE